MNWLFASSEGEQEELTLSNLPRLALSSIVVLASTALTPPSYAFEYASVIQLSALNGITGFKINGEAAGDLSGMSVASAGDVRGDNFEDGSTDVIIGAPNADPNGADSGASYVVFGKTTGFPAVLNLATLAGPNGFKINGQVAADRNGISVASAGDVNRDGFGDFIIGSQDASPNGFRSGSSYVVFGKALPFSNPFNLSALTGANGFKINGEDGASGHSVATAGDVSGNPFPDLIIGAPNADRNGADGGASYVVFGKCTTFSSPLELSSLTGANGFEIDGEAAVDVSGAQVASAGDMNGDGVADVIIGAPYADPHGAKSGRSYVIFGKKPAFPAVFNLSALIGTNGFKINGEVAGDLSGQTVASAGDVNGDGYGDVIVGSPNASPNGFRSGSSYVVFGKPTAFAATIELSALTGTNGFKINGEDGASGRHVASAGDVNADGFSDLIIGAPNADRNGADSGASYVVFGKASGFAATLELSSLIGTNGFEIDGEAFQDVSGHVASAGDLNGDGFRDVIIGAPYADPNGSKSGRSYVVFGRAPDSARTRTGSAAKQYISGGPFADTLIGLGGQDALEGRGGADILNGGQGSHDIAYYLHASAGVKVNLALPATFNTGEAAGDSYVSIEDLVGSLFADRLIGNDSNNEITGVRGADELTGGAGADLFNFNYLPDSPAGTGRDRITDFLPGVDRINLSHIDAKTGPCNDAFSFIGTAPFSQVKGQLRAFQFGPSVIVAGDVDGNGVADIQIQLTSFSNLAGLTALDFIL